MTHPVCLNIRAETKWPPFCCRHFQMCYLEWRYMKFDWKFHWNFFLRVQLTIFRPGNKSLFEPMLVSLSTHICVIRSQWVNRIYFGLNLLVRATTNLTGWSETDAALSILDPIMIYQDIRTRKFIVKIRLAYYYLISTMETTVNSTFIAIMIVYIYIPLLYNIYLTVMLA